MSFPRYPSYRDSQAQGLGRLPVDWKAMPLKRLIKRLESGTSVNAIDIPAEVGQLGVLKTSCVYSGFFDPTENKTVIEEDLTRATCWLTGNTLIVSRMNTPDLVGSAGVVKDAPKNIVLPDRLWQIHFNDDCLPELIHYWTRTDYYRAQVKVACSGTSQSMQNLGQEDFSSIIVSLPPETEQKRIVEFLDHETAKIDALVEEQKRLIKLLKEKRRAVISQAVTKGLDPNVPMKDSGVEWLGEVPAHWNVACLKHAVAPRRDAMVDGPFGSSINTEIDYVTEGIPVIRTVNITNKGFSSANMKYMRREKFDQLKRHAVYPGDVLFSKVGTIGNACVLPSETPEAVLSTTGSCKITLNHNYMIAEYLVYCIQSMNEELMQIANANVQPFLNMVNIKNLKLPVPSLDEQIEIITAFKVELQRLDSMINQASTLEDILGERRAALISAAVMGKIDVRNWQPPESAATEDQPTERKAAS